MAQRKHHLLSLLTLTLAAQLAFGQESQVDPSPAESEKPASTPFSKEEACKKWQALSAEQREKFKKNLERWKRLPAEKRDNLLVIQERRQARREGQAEQALQHSGLKLDQAKTGDYKRRYIEERRKIEAALQKELEAKRAPMLKEMTDRLEKEFAPSAAAPASAP